MTINEQKEINTACVNAYNYAMEDLANTHGHYKTKRLRFCSATVLTTDNYRLLRSYNTIVAIIDRNTGTCFDVLRYVYGYTATSAQHIRKFAIDYASKKDYTRRYI